MTSNFSTFKPGDKVKVTGYTVKDGVRDDSGAIYTRDASGFRGPRGITVADNVISEELTYGYATILFEGVDG